MNATAADSRWEHRLVELVDYQAKHGKWPVYAPDADTDTRVLGQWLMTQRKMLRVQAPDARQQERIRLLDESAPSWRALGGAEDGLTPGWLARLEQVCRFHAEHGRLPRSRGGSEERVLGRWIDAQRAAARGTGTGLWTPERGERLDAALPGWLRKSRPLSTRTGSEAGTAPARGLSARWLLRAEDLQRFLQREGRQPRRNSPGDHERGLAQWLSRQRTAAAGEPRSSWTASRERRLTELVPGWQAADM